MSLQLVKPNPYSRPGIGSLPSALDVETDAVFSALTDNIDLIVSQFGSMVTPAQNLKAALSAMEDGATLILLPGVYQLNSDLVINRGCTVRGLGDVAIQLGADCTVVLAGNYCRIADLGIIKLDRDRSLCALLVSGDHCKVSDIRTLGPTQNAVRVTGSHAMIDGLWCEENADHVLNDADVYITNAAVYATVLGTSWSTTRTFSLSYKALTNASEAANGPSAIIEVR